MRMETGKNYESFQNALKLRAMEKAQKGLSTTLILIEDVNRALELLGEREDGEGFVSVRNLLRIELARLRRQETGFRKELSYFDGGKK